MANGVKHLLEFGPYRVDAGRRLLMRGQDPVSLSPKAFDLLLVLLERNGEVVSKDDLMNLLWPDTFVEESNLGQHVFQLRKALGERPQDHGYIITVPGRGYRFAKEVRPLALQLTNIARDEKREERGEDREEQEIVVASRSLAQVVIERQGKKDLRFWLTFTAMLAAVVVAVGLYWHSENKPKLTAKDTIVLGDFDNKTGDAVFDGTLRQGLSAQLEQSPFLNLLSDQRIAQTLSLMTQPKDVRLSPEVAREVCQRTASAAVLDGTIAQIGARYLLTLNAINCPTGDTLASTEAEASDKDHVLDALGKMGSDMRRRLGESLATVEKFDVTLRQATTPSLEALKADSLGEKFLYRGDAASAPQYFQRALELDPNFAMAYLQLGITYFTFNQPGRAREYFAKAFALREHASEREKLQIAAAYYGHVTGEIDKAIGALQEVIEIYRHNSAYNGLTELYAQLGQYDKSAEAARTLVVLDPDKNWGFINLAMDDLALQDFSGARQIIQQAQAHSIDSYLLHSCLYTLAFLQSDFAGMTEQERWFASHPAYENQGLALAAFTEAYAGHVNKARQLTRSAADSAVRADNQEDAAMYQASDALQEAAYGNSVEARKSAADAIKRAPANPSVAVQVALAFAMIGQTSRARELAQEMNNRFPLDTQLQLLGLPATAAQLQLNQQQAEPALDTLRAGLPVEFANTTFSSINISCLYPTYIRGQAYLAAGQGADAAGEFQKVIDHNGIVGNCWTGALAHLGIGRANALLSATSHGGQATVVRTRAIGAYKDFFTLWKDADSDIPILKQAKAEYAKLQ
jgi:eukaryotic-like serine/threonine-protein kinase